MSYIVKGIMIFEKFKCYIKDFVQSPGQGELRAVLRECCTHGPTFAPSINSKDIQVLWHEVLCLRAELLSGARSEGECSQHRPFRDGPSGLKVIDRLSKSQLLLTVLILERESSVA